MSVSTHIIIVNYNAGDWLKRAVKSALDYTDGKVSVVDNASHDSSVADTQTLLQEPCLRWHLNDENLGFAAANNQVLKNLEEDYAILLNPDCELGPQTVAELLKAFAEQPTLGLASCLIKDEHGVIQASSKRRFPTPWSAFVRLFRLDLLLPNHPKFKNFDYADKAGVAGERCEVVEAVSGAFMMVRKTALEEVGLLDEAYFMHCEDLDWCKRFSLAGWQVGFVDSVSVTHAKGVSSKSRPIGVLWNLHAGMVRFFDKFYFSQTSLPLRWLVKFGIGMSFVFRALLSIVRPSVK